MDGLKIASIALRASKRYVLGSLELKKNLQFMYINGPLYHGAQGKLPSLPLSLGFSDSTTFLVHRIPYV